MYDIIEGRMKGKDTRRRKRMHLLSDLMKNRNCTEVKREAQDRAGWRVKNLINLPVIAGD